MAKLIQDLSIGGNLRKLRETISTATASSWTK